MHCRGFALKRLVVSIIGGIVVFQITGFSILIVCQADDFLGFITERDIQINSPIFIIPTSSSSLPWLTCNSYLGFFVLKQLLLEWNQIDANASHDFSFCGKSSRLRLGQVTHFHKMAERPL
jgi:hypothetical protein